MPNTLLRAGMAALALAVLAGCQPSVTVSPSAPSPSFTCTPEAGGDAYPCSQAQYDEMVAQDALYAEAEAVYRTFLAEDIRIMRAGGVTEPTPVLLETTTGAFLEDVMGEYRAMESAGLRVVDGEARLMSLDRRPGVAKGGSLVAMVACLDGRSLRVKGIDGSVRKGFIARDELYFGRKFGSGLQVIGADGGEVKECA